MRKYWLVFTTSWQNEFIYRLNFILWRLRNVLRFLMTYFLWTGVFLVNHSVFGYSQTQMLTYVFLVLAVSTLILSSPSSDTMGGEIANGELSSYLLKPISYLKYWFVRDLSSKLLNIIFAILELSLLWIWIKPEIQFPQSIFNLLGFIIACMIAIGTYFTFRTTAILAAFWTPENTWGLAFLVLVLMELLSGMIFPLDILPQWAQILLQFTPFPYLIYFPVSIFIGKISDWEIVRILIQSSLWLLLMIYITNFIWKKGLKVYGSEGR